MLLHSEWSLQETIAISTMWLVLKPYFKPIFKKKVYTLFYCIVLPECMHEHYMCPVAQEGQERLDALELEL